MLIFVIVEFCVCVLLYSKIWNFWGKQPSDELEKVSAWKNFSKGFLSIVLTFHQLSFHFLSPLKTKNFNFYEIQFILSWLVLLSKKPLANPRSQRFTLVFSAKSFVVLLSTFRTLIHFELTVTGEHNACYAVL